MFGRSKLFSALIITVLPFLSLSCSGILESNDASHYDLVKSLETASVEGRLVQYSRGTLDNEISNGQGKTYDRLNIAFMTDSYMNLGNSKENKQNVVDAINFVNNVRVPIATVLAGGNVSNSSSQDKDKHISGLKDFFDLGWRAKMPFLFTKGDDDINSKNVTPDKVLSDKDWNGLWFDKAEKEYKIVRKTKSSGEKSGYYYYDLEDWKVRIISADCYDLDFSKTDESGKILYRATSSYYISSEQFNWIVDKALNFDDKPEKDWGVIVFMNFYRPTDHEGTSAQPRFASVYPKFNKMLQAFNTQSVFLEKYEFPENHFYDLVSYGNWTKYADRPDKPYVICVLSGHIFADANYNYDGINHIVTANQYCSDEYSDKRIVRVPATRTQNLFDILNIDLVQRKIRVFRYGAGENCYGEGGDRFLPDGLSF